MAQMVISLSKGLPLSLLWNVVNPGGGYRPILDIAVQDSTRFKSMDLRVGLSRPLEIKRLLTSPTPALESLTVEVNQVPSMFWSWDGAEVEEFALSEGAPLKHLNLKDFPLTIESHRFSNLVTLFLDGSAVPASLGTLLQILRTSAQLEQLAISRNTRGEEDLQLSPLITLPRLKSLKIEHITADYCMTPLASIYAPACSRVNVKDSAYSQPVGSLDVLLWQPEGIQAAALLGFISSPESQIGGVPATVSITQISTTIFISCLATEVWVKDKDGFRWRSLEFRRREPLKLLKLIGESLFRLLYPFSSSLVDPRLMSPHDLLDLRPWSSTLESLNLEGYAASLSAMEQLGQRIAAPSGTGAVATESWMCHNLREISLYIPGDVECATYIAALRSLVRKRWSGEDSDLAPAIQPKWFRLNSRRYRELQDVQSEIQRVLPSFTFEST
ncbi:hypothetical protein FRC05_008616 [Tulasnella sp. 425]|nr:hypothetical protein FRC05_008616 [Tulasnella sp. 425]